MLNMRSCYRFVGVQATATSYKGHASYKSQATKACKCTSYQSSISLLFGSDIASESLGRIGCRKISYDNMCHLDNLIVAKLPLPLPGDLKYIWSNITKVAMATTFKHSAVASLLQVIDDFYTMVSMYGTTEINLADKNIVWMI